MNRDRAVLGLMYGAGIAVWLGVTQWSGRREAWDSGLYFTAGLPLLMLLCALAGFAAPERPWRWAAAAFVGQPAALLCLRGFGSMLPLGLAVFGVLMVPCVVTAYAGALVRTSWLRVSEADRSY